MPEDILSKIGTLSVKMRILKARSGAGSDTAKLNDRQLLILEMLADKKEMSVNEVCRCFKGVGKSTISMDIKLFRTKNWTQKRFSREDERVHILELTEQGKKKVAEIREHRMKGLSALMDAIGKKASVVKILNPVLDRAIDELDKVLDSSDTDTG